MAGGITHSIGILVKGNDALTRSLTKADASLTKFRKNVQRTAERINRKLSAPEIDTTAIDKASSKMKGMGTKAIIAGGAMAAGYGLAVKSASDFETAMVEVSTLVDTSTTDMEALKTQVQDMSTTFGQMPIDTAKSLYTTISAGFGEADDATLMLEGALKLARGGLTDTQTAVDGLTSIMNSYGMAAENVSDVSDKMFVAMKAGKTTIGELSNSMGRVTPLAAAAGVEIDELLAATSALTLGGMNTKEAVTSLRGIIAAVTKPTVEATKAAEQLGVQYSTGAIKSMGFANWMAHVKNKVGDNEQAMSQLFGRVEALSGALALTGEQANSMTAILKEMGGAAGATEVAFLKVDETSAAAFGRAKANMTVIKQTVGDALLPMITGLANAFGWIAQKMKAFSDAHPFLAKLVTVLGAVTAGVITVGGAALIMGGMIMAAMTMVNISTGGILLAVGAIITAITSLVMIFTSGSESIIDETTILGKVLAALRDIFYAMALPVAYGIGFLVGAFSGGWGNIRRLTTELWTDIKLAVVWSWEALQDTVVRGITVVVGGLKKAWSFIVDLTSRAWTILKEKVTTVVAAVQMKLTAGWNIVKGLFRSGAAAVKTIFAALQMEVVSGLGVILGFFTRTWISIKTGLSEAWASIRAAFRTSLDFITGIWTAAWTGVRELFVGIWDKMKTKLMSWLDWLKDLKDIFLEAGKRLIEALWQGIKEAWGWLKDKIKDKMQELRNLLPFSDAKEGPLSQLTASGSALVTTFAEGIDAVSNVPVKAVSKLLSKVRDLMPFSDAREGPLADLTESGRSVLPTFAAGIEDTRVAPVEAVAGSLGDLAMPQPPPPAPTARSGAPSVTFENGAFQITVQHSDDSDSLDELEDRLTNIFARVADQLGGA